MLRGIARKQFGGFEVSGLALNLVLYSYSSGLSAVENSFRVVEFIKPPKYAHDHACFCPDLFPSGTTISLCGLTWSAEQWTGQPGEPSTIAVEQGLQQSNPSITRSDARTNLRHIMWPNNGPSKRELGPLPATVSNWFHLTYYVILHCISEPIDDADVFWQCGTVVYRLELGL